MSLASEAAGRAGDLLAASFGMARLTSETRRDVKLDQDRQAQDVIVEHLSMHSRHPILTEESGWIGSEPARDAPYWVVDPLDGSFNYLFGIPLCCVSIALCNGMTPLAGCVHDFLRRDTLTGAPGLGLRLNGQPLAAHRAGSGILATGVPAGGARQGLGLDDALQRWRKVRLIGSAALSLAWLARGRFDAYHEDGIRWWDVAAGLALVAAAGGHTRVRAAEGGNGRVCAEARLDIHAWGTGVDASPGHGHETPLQ